MPEKIALSRFFAGAFSIAALFALLRAMLPLDDLVVLLNGLFAGAMTAIIVAYGRLLWNTILGRRPYDDVRQMTFGFALAWGAIFLTVANSIWLHATAIEPLRTTDLVALSRFLAIIAACMQVTAPDFGLGLFHGRDRKVLWAAAIVGLVVASGVVGFQGANASVIGLGN